MFEMLKEMYEEGMLTKAMLKKAVVEKKWITAEEYEQIVGEPME